MTILEFRYVIDPIPLKMGDTHHVTLVISPPQQLPWSPETSREAIIWAPLKEFGPKQLGEFGRWPNPPLDGNPNGSTEQKEGPKLLRSLQLHIVHRVFLGYNLSIWEMVG